MVLDLRMPSMTGWQLWDRMRADREWQSIAVIAVTGEGDATTRARDAGMCELFTKPVDFDALIGAIQRYCRSRRIEARRTSDGCHRSSAGRGRK